VPLVTRAYLEGELAVLREHCAPEMLERLSGIIRAEQAQARPFARRSPAPPQAGRPGGRRAGRRGRAGAGTAPSAHRGRLP